MATPTIYTLGVYYIVSIFGATLIAITNEKAWVFLSIFMLRFIDKLTTVSIKYNEESNQKGRWSIDR